MKPAHPTREYLEATSGRVGNLHFPTNVDAVDALPLPETPLTNSTADISMTLLKEENSRLWQHIGDLSTALRNAEEEIASLRQANAKVAQVEAQLAKLAEWKAACMAEFELQLGKAKMVMQAEFVLKEDSLRMEQKAKFAEQERVLQYSESQFVQVLDLLKKFDQAFKSERDITDAQRNEIQCLRIELENMQNSTRCPAPTLAILGGPQTAQSACAGISVPSNAPPSYSSS